MEEAVLFSDDSEVCEDAVYRICHRYEHKYVIERLFYRDSFRVGNATLPRSWVRARLKLLDYMILQIAEAKLPPTWTGR